MAIKIGLNIGSGQRPFNSTPEVKWINVDSQEKWNPDLLCDATTLPYADQTIDYVVIHHCLEHLHCGEGSGMVKEAYRVLSPHGSLLVFVPNLRALAERWLAGGLSTQIYVTNLYGAYMGHADDEHKWGFDPESLTHFLWECAPWTWVGAFDWRNISGADCARDFWILDRECVK